MLELRRGNLTLMRPTLLLLTLLSVAAFGQTIDPIGFCPPPATVGGCTTANGLGNETIGVGTTTFGMMKNGGKAGDTSTNPWYLLVLVPNDVGGAPTITSSSFTQSGTTQDVGQFLPTTKGDVYDFSSSVIGANPKGDSSMNAANLFCDGNSYPCANSNEIKAFGSLPSYFEVFVYTFGPGIVEKTPYTFSVGGSGLEDGTYLAGYGGSNPFSTPFTTTGLVNGPGCTPDTCTGTPGGGPSVPEPASVLLFGTVGLFAANALRKKIRA